MSAMKGYLEDALEAWRTEGTIVPDDVAAWLAEAEVNPWGFGLDDVEAGALAAWRGRRGRRAAPMSTRTAEREAWYEAELNSPTWSRFPTACSGRHGERARREIASTYRWRGDRPRTPGRHTAYPVVAACSGCGRTW